MGNKYNVSSKEVNRFVKSWQRNKEFTPKALKKVLWDELGAKSTLEYGKTMTKPQFLRLAQGLKEKQKAMPRLLRKPSPYFTPKKAHTDILEEREAEANTGSDVPLALEKLPKTLPTREFVNYFRKATGKSVESVMQKMGIAPGPKAPRKGAEPHITDTKMGRILARAREKGILTSPNIGAKIAWQEQLTERDRAANFGSEDRDVFRKYLAAVEAGQIAREDLPPGIERTVGRITQGGALHHAGQQPPATSAFAKKGELDDLKTHATTGSDLTRRTPGPMSSSQRYGRPGKNRPDPSGKRGSRPQLAESPNLSFDID